MAASDTGPPRLLVSSCRPASCAQAERFMISQLKDKCGFEYTAKLQRMFNDVRISNDINKAFTTSLGQSLSLGFNVLVLQTGAWPLTSSTSSTLALSSELASAVEKFTLYYNVRGGNWWDLVASIAQPRLGCSKSTTGGA